MDLLTECEEKLAWPWQVYITLVCLLAKEVKGERLISLLTMLHRIWSCSRKHFAAEWCNAKAGFWDDAVRGSSPLQASLRRLVADELTQHIENQEACTVLFDAESFYESISLSLVARAVLLGMALLTYAGVRFLTAGCSGFIERIVISNGVAAGCAQRNHAARLVLYDILQKSHELHPSTSTAQWVDDLTQRTQSPPSEELVRDLQEDKLAVASKSEVIATTPNRLCQLLPDMTKTSRKPVKPRIWGWVCPVQESQCVEPCPSDGPRKWTSKQASARLWRTGAWAQKAYGTAAVGRRRRGSSRRERELLKQHDAEVEAGV